MCSGRLGSIGAAGGVLGIAVGVEQVQRAGRADVEDGQETWTTGGHLDPHPVAGAEPDLVGGRWDLLHVAGQAAGRLIADGSRRRVRSGAGRPGG